MKFRVERNFLVKTEEFIELNPKDFIHCANILELNDEIEDYISNKCEHPNHPGFQSSEEIGCRYYENWPFETIDIKSFYLEWQKLKGLPQEL